MRQLVIENPVINSAFAEPTRHYRFTLQTHRAALGPLSGRTPVRDAAPESRMSAFLQDIEQFNPETVPTARRLVDSAARQMNEPGITVNRGALTWTPWHKTKGSWYQLIRLQSDAGFGALLAARNWLANKAHGDGRGGA